MEFAVVSSSNMISSLQGLHATFELIGPHKGKSVGAPYSELG
jgi:hypothetical protein